ncbi:MAG: hypothetical protein JWQ97_1626 [Phenylobacterium sp.]|nr:hypothetical protein [Phenylobacterium sp.]
MTATTQEASRLRAPRIQTAAGWTLTGLFTAFMLFDAGIKLARLPIVEAAGGALHLPPGSGFPIGVLEALLLALYLFPRTALLGAVLFTGLFGGTAAVHLAAGNPLFSHILFGIYLGVMAWGGLWLREPAVRALLPIRKG